MWVKIKNLRLKTIIGIYDWEKKNKQEVRIHLEILFDGKKAALSDQIEKTLDYEEIWNQVSFFVEENRFNLIEKIAYDVAQIVLQNEKALEVRVEVEKPGALAFTDSVSIIHHEIKSKS